MKKTAMFLILFVVSSIIKCSQVRPLPKISSLEKIRLMAINDMRRQVAQFSFPENSVADLNTRQREIVICRVLNGKMSVEDLTPLEKQIYEEYKRESEESE